MATATIKIRFMDDDGEVHQKRFAVSDDSLTVSAAIESGLNRLQIAHLTCQLEKTAQKRGSDTHLVVHDDDFIELDHDYIFIDPRLKAESTMSASSTMAANNHLAANTITPPPKSRLPFVRVPASTVSSPRSPTYAGYMSTPPRSTFVRVSASALASPASPIGVRYMNRQDPAQTTPTSSRTTLARPFTSSAVPLSDSSTSRCFGTTTDTASAELEKPSDNPLSLSAGNTPTSLNGIQKHATLSKSKRINNFYLDNMKNIDEFYVSKKDVSGRMFHGIDVIERFGFFQHCKAAFYILCQQTNPELYDAAVYVITDACFDILRHVYPKLNVIPAEKQMLAELVSILTGYTALKNITLANRSGTLDFKIKNFRRHHLEAFSEEQSSSVKKKKMTATAADIDSEIDRLSIELNPESDSRVLHELYEKSAVQRSSWQKKLHADPNLPSGIVSKLVSKFRHITDDISLIHYDFIILMSARRTMVQSLSEAFRRLVPAVYQMGRNLGIPEADITYDSPDEREYMAGSLLVAILKKKCSKSPVDYSRLVIDHCDSLDYRSAMEKRKREGINAPTIFVIGSAPAVSYYIAADDMVFRVRGRFADALQSYMELVFVSNVKYDNKTTGISHFFEYLMNIKEHRNTSRMAVSKELEEIAASISNPTELIDRSQTVNGSLHDVL